MSNIKETFDETVGLYDKWSNRYKILYVRKKKKMRMHFLRQDSMAVLHSHLTILSEYLPLRKFNFRDHRSDKINSRPFRN